MNQEENKTSHRKPQEFIAQILGRMVAIRLNDGSLYEGQLVCLDGFMNVALERCKELTHKQEVLGDVFIRGNNIAYISELPKETSIRELSKT